MPKIKIMGESLDAGKPRKVPNNRDLNPITERFQPSGKYDLTLDKSFKRESPGKK